ncbi:MAG: hypothetical protein RJS97_02605 [Parvibaculaceae bacterium]
MAENGTSFDYTQLEKLVESSSGVDICVQILTEIWRGFLTPKQSPTSAEYESASFDGDQDPVWKSLRSAAREKLEAGPAETPSGNIRLEDHEEWCMGVALARAAVDDYPDGELRIEFAMALVAYPGVRREAFLRTVTKALSGNRRERIVRSLRGLAHRIRDEAGLTVYAGEKESFEALLKEWRAQPSLEELWYSHRFESVLSHDGRVDVLELLAPFNPGLFLELLEETKTPTAVIEGLLSCRRDDGINPIELLLHAPTCFTRSEDGDIQYNGGMTVPLLCRVFVDRLRDWEARRAPEDRKVTSSETEDECREFARALLASSEKEATALYAMAWLMWRDWASPSELVSERVAVKALAEVAAEIGVTLLAPHFYSAALANPNEEALRSVFETGAPAPAPPSPRHHTVHLATAYAALVLSGRESDKDAENAAPTQADVLVSLYRQIALQQYIGLNSYEAPIHRAVWAQVMVNQSDPSVIWKTLWDDLAQQRHRSGYSSREHGLFTSSIFHLAVGMAMIHCSITYEERLPRWVPTFWKELLLSSVHAAPLFSHDRDEVEYIATNLFCHIGGLSNRDPDTGWFDIVAEALGSFGGNAYLVTRSVEALVINDINIASIAAKFRQITETSLASVVQEYLGWDAMREERFRRLSNLSSRQVELGIKILNA